MKEQIELKLKEIAEGLCDYINLSDILLIFLIREPSLSYMKHVKIHLSKK